ncbi:hypothetical protein BJY18_002917 [Amycolatopsis jiangsuensis]|uniref:Uncharacterized protein n=1 Tax=Amycolatopsis jiangsuensis TaxID=1181879 RepID=A0A840IW40_9PSEU|nr:hypothetical protein [Amycolatopsis jiangsuensis]
MPDFSAGPAYRALATQRRRRNRRQRRHRTRTQLRHRTTVPDLAGFRCRTCAQASRHSTATPDFGARHRSRRRTGLRHPATVPEPDAGPPHRSLATQRRRQNPMPATPADDGPDSDTRPRCRSPMPDLRTGVSPPNGDTGPRCPTSPADDGPAPAPAPAPAPDHSVGFRCRTCVQGSRHSTTTPEPCTDDATGQRTGLRTCAQESRHQKTTPEPGAGDATGRQTGLRRRGWCCVAQGRRSSGGVTRISSVFRSVLTGLDAHQPALPAEHSSHSAGSRLTTRPGTGPAARGS